MNSISRKQTHFKSDKIPKIHNKILPLAYHATNPDGKTKGVSILISKQTPFQPMDSIMDPMGRFIFLKGKIGYYSITTTNIFAPNTIGSILLQNKRSTNDIRFMDSYPWG